MTAASSTLWYNGPESILKVLITTPIVSIAVIIFIRISGKRSTSQMNSFDWILTVAMGSLVASPIMVNGVGILAAIRESGHADPSHIEAVIFESDAQLSVIPRSSDQKSAAIDKLIRD